MATDTGEYEQIRAATSPEAAPQSTAARATQSAKDSTPQWVESWHPAVDAGTANPVFTLLKRIRANRGIVEERTVRWVQQPVFILSGLWAVVAVAVLLTDDDLSLYTAVSSLLWALFVLSLVDKLVLDFAAASAVLDTVPRDIENGTWGLVVLSDLPTRRYVQAYHAEAQIRSWRLMCRVIGFRLGLVVTGLLHFVLLPVLIPASRIEQIVTPYYTRPRIANPLAGMLESLLHDPLSLMVIIPVLLALAVMSVIYVAEPRWRLRALAAASVAISTQQRKSPLDLMTAVSAVGRVWVAQMMMGVFAFALLWMIGVIFGPMFASISSVYISGWVFLLYLLPVWYVIRYGYQSLTRRWQNRAYHHLRTLGGTRW